MHNMQHHATINKPLISLDLALILPHLAIQNPALPGSLLGCYRKRGYLVDALCIFLFLFTHTHTLTLLILDSSNCASKARPCLISDVRSFLKPCSSPTLVNSNGSKKPSGSLAPICCEGWKVACSTDCCAKCPSYL